MPFFFSPSYLVITLIGMVAMGWAQWRVHSAYKKYSKIGARTGMTGAQVARQLLDSDRLFDVSIEKTSGKLDDHYDPQARVLRLSEGVHDGSSLASIGVAAHEMGHALQHAEGYAPLSFRQAFFPGRRFLFACLVHAFADRDHSWCDTTRQRSADRCGYLSRNLRSLCPGDTPGRVRRESASAALA